MVGGFYNESTISFIFLQPLFAIIHPICNSSSRLCVNIKQRLKRRKGPKPAGRQSQNENTCQETKHIHLTGSREGVQNKDAITAPGGIKLVTFNNSLSHQPRSLPPFPPPIPHRSPDSQQLEMNPFQYAERKLWEAKVLMNYHHSCKDKIFFHYSWLWLC